MKKVLFWITAPATFLLLAVILSVENLANGCAEACHAWEAWCFDYKKEHPDMKYVGGGVWVSK